MIRKQTPLLHKPLFFNGLLGDTYPMRPMDQGFDESLVHRGGGIARPSEPPANARRHTDPLLEKNGRTVPTSGYCTDVYVDLHFDCRDGEESFDAYQVVLTAVC